MRRISVFDCPSLFAATETIARRFDQQRPALDYTALRQRTSTIRSQAGWAPSEMDLAIVSVDTRSDKEARFTTALERIGYTLDRIDYRHAFVSMPPGRHPGEDGERSTISIAPRIAYLAGLLARSPDSQLLVVSHSFEIYFSLQDLARRANKGAVGIAYFSSLLDFRYRSSGLLDAQPTKGGVRFYDLEDWLPELIGGASLSNSDSQKGGEVFAKIGT